MGQRTAIFLYKFLVLFHYINTCITLINAEVKVNKTKMKGSSNYRYKENFRPLLYGQLIYKKGKMI